MRIETSKFGWALLKTGACGFVSITSFTGSRGEHRVCIQQIDDSDIIDQEINITINLAESILKEDIVDRLKRDYLSSLKEKR